MPRRSKGRAPLPAPPPAFSPTPPSPPPSPPPPASPPRPTTPPLRSAIRQSSRPRTPSRRLQFEDQRNDRDRRAIRRAQELKQGDAVREAKKAAELKKKEEFKQRQHDNALKIRQLEQQKQRVQAEEQARREQSMQAADEEEDMDVHLLNHTVRRNEMREIDHELEVEAANFDVYVTLKAFVDKKLIYSTNKGKMYRRELIEGHEDYEFEMENRITDEPFEGDWEIYNRSVAVRSRSSRDRIHIQTVDDFSTEGWAQIEDLLLQQWILYEYPLELTVEVKARSIPPPKTTVKRTRESTSSVAPDSPSNSPQHKRERASRTTQARGYNEAKAEMYQRLKEADQGIMERWQCTLPNCRNHPKFCLIRGLDHYPLLTPDIWHWARQIEAQNATFDGPPTPLYEDILNRGPADNNYKAPLHHQKIVQKKAEKMDFTERMGQFMEMQGNMLHMNMTQQMAESMERQQRRQEEKEEREAAREAARDAVLSRYPPPPPPPPTYEPLPPSNPLSLPARSIPRPFAPIAPPPLDRPSSPITVSEHEEEAITMFFRWKEDRYKLEEGKKAIRNALQLVRREMWTLDDLRAMENDTTVQYRRAMAIGLPDGLARQFHRDLRAFKPAWREGTLLLSLGERQT